MVILWHYCEHTLLEPFISKSVPTRSPLYSFRNKIHIYCRITLKQNTEYIQDQPVLILTIYSILAMKIHLIQVNITQRVPQICLAQSLIQTA